MIHDLRTAVGFFAGKNRQVRYLKETFAGRRTQLVIHPV